MTRKLLAFLLALCFLNTISYAQQLTCDDEFNLVGTATQQDECFVLTQNTPSQGGCAWFLEPLDFTMPFTISVSCNFGTNDGGADGICLVFQTESDASCGGIGIDIGAGGISNSFIIEADTWDNGVANGDIPNDHLAVNINGDMQNPISGPVDLGNIEDGGDYNFDFSWDPATMTYDVSVAGGSLSGTFDIINNCFGGETMAWWGFTSSTGGATNRHSVCPGLPPEVVADAVGNLPSFVLPCADATLQLDGTNSDQGGDFIYEWSTFDGNIVDGEFSLTPTIDQAGTYMLTVTNTVTNCTDESEVTITQENLIADTFAPDDLDCDLNPVTIYATGSSSGANITYTWDTFDGNIVADLGSSIEVDAGGTYILTVTYDDGTFFCDEQTQVTIAAPENPPMAFVVDAVLYCDPTTVQLDGTGSSDAGFYGYEWFSSEGNIVADGNTLYPTVDEPGFYTLRVTNLNSFCFEEFEIYVDDGRIPPHAEAVVDEMLSCSMNSVTIDGTLSDGGPDIIYEWSTTNGNIISGQFDATPSVDEAGIYTLTVTNTATGCTAETSVEVRRDNSVVSASIEPPSEFTCNSTSLMLDGSGSSVGPDIVYSWSTDDGQFLGPVDDFMAEIGLPGTYTLTVTHSSLGCTETSTVTVVPNDTPPTAEAGSNAVFNCGDSSINLSGSASGGASLSYQWTTTNGTILSGANTLTPSVGSTGTYILTVTNPDNGCTDTDEVMVMGNADTPVAQAMANNVIDCETSSVVVTGNGSSTGSDITYEWSTTNGSIQGGNSGLSIIATAAGTYQLEVTNTTSGCRSMAMVEVTEDTIPPVVDAGTADIFRCGDSSLQLSGTATGPRPDLTYTWTTADGNIVSGPNTLMPTVGGAGTYTLTVRDSLNGCTASDQVVVNADVNIPSVSINVNDTLDCATTSLALDGSSSDNGPNYTISWTSNNGQFVSGQDGLQPVIDAGGIYVLTITNTDNNCMNSASVSILMDTLTPPADIALVDTINCSQDTVELLALQGDLSNYTYQWTTTDGLLVGGATDTLTQAISGGSYRLLVRNPQNACVATDVVVVVQDTLTPQLNIAAPPTLTCTQTSVELVGSGQNLPSSIQYQWSTTDGNLSGATNTDQATAIAAGTYQLIATNPLNTCADTASVRIDVSDDLPSADAGADQTLNCDLITTTLGGSNTSNGSTISYLWSRLEGGNLPTDDLLTLDITQAGTYVLAVTDSANDCVQRDTVSVDANFSAPQASVAPPNIITCTDTLASLDGSSSLGQGTLSYRWFSMAGSFAGATDIPQAEATQAGTYFLEVTDAANGCRDTTMVNVAQDDNFPQASIDAPLNIDCNNPSVALMGSIGGGGNLNFSWQTSDGSFIGATDQLQTQVDAPGEYRLLVEDLDNNCRTQARVDVLQDTIAPIANAGMPAILNCSETSLPLNGSATGPMGNLSYTWTGPGLAMPATTPDPTIDLPGRYLLEVSNTDNGCRDTSSVLISADFMPPSLQLTTPDTLTCLRTQVLLDASASTQGPEINYLWSGPEMGLTDQNQQSVQTPGPYTLILENTTNGCRDTASVTVAVDRQLPIVNASTADVINCDQPTVSLLSTGSDTGADYTYTWRDPQGQSIGNGTEAVAGMGGQYTLQLTDSRNSCTDSSQVTVMVDTLSPILSALPAMDLNCIQTSTILSAEVMQAGNQPIYAWTTLDGNILSPLDREAAEVDRAGDYQLLVTNPDNGCTESIAISVSADISPPEVSINPTAPLTCADQDEFLQLRSSETLSSYQWTASNGGQVTGNAGGSTLLINVPGTYTVEVVATDNGCTNSASVDISQDTLAPQVVIAAAPSLDCAQTSTQLDATASSGGDTYRWTTMDGQIDNGANSLQATISRGGTYQLYILNSSNGCSSSSSITVEQDEELPEVNIANPGLLSCVVNSVDLDATSSTPGLTYQWTTPNGNILSGADGLNPTVDQIGTYQLQITNPDNNCQVSANIQVQADRTPPRADAGDNFELSCDQSATQLDASASDQGDNFTYLWTGLAGEIVADPNSQTPSISQTGLYQLLVTNTANGCTSSDQVEVTQDLPVATSSIAPPICTGDLGAIVIDQVTGGVPPYLYAIDGQNLSAESQFTNLRPGSYELLVEDAAGCVYTEELILAQPDSFAIAFVRDEWTINWGDSIQLEVSSTAPVDSSYRINWLETEWLSCTDCLDPVARPLRTFNYGVEIISPDGCRDEAYVRIFVEPNRPIYFPTAFSPNGREDNEIFYPFSKVGAVTLIPSFRIFDRWGNSVFEITDIQPNNPIYGWDGTHRGQPMNPGVFVYLAEVVFSDGTIEVFSGDITLLR